LSQTGPYRFHGSSYYSKIGLRRELDLIIDTIPGGSNVDLRFNAQITDEGLLAGAVTTVIFLPVAVLGGALSYTEYETDAQNLISAFWQQMVPATARAGGPVPSSMPSVPPPCQGCGAALLPDWRVCPYCGRHRSGGN
jgi:hypothetical protein